MIRRRRPVREIHFSFDSFLDVVTNVVGIIIRLILVVWVSARSYSSLQATHRAKPPAAPAKAEAPLPPDPLADELERHRQELANAQARLLKQMRDLELTEGNEKETENEIAALGTRRQELEQDSAHIEEEVKAGSDGSEKAALTLVELRARQKKLTEDLQALESLPSLKKTLHYRTPVSRPVHSEELLFECAGGRVTFVDIATMLGEIKDELEEKGKVLQHTWQVTYVTRPAGAFRLRYTLERQRDTLDVAFAAAAPSAHGGFSYSLSEWIAEPVASMRGETTRAALASGSQFRLMVDALDPQQSVVTFWVYPDSFDLYRQLRDYLYERDITVAGRPLPNGVPITCSRRGSRSRGQ
jgi:hypothetical protein